MERWELVFIYLLMPSRWGDGTAYLRANCKENDGAGDTDARRQTLQEARGASSAHPEPCCRAGGRPEVGKGLGAG